MTKWTSYFISPLFIILSKCLVRVDSRTMTIKLTQNVDTLTTMAHVYSLLCLLASSTFVECQGHMANCG
jgi:hypothetical protein